MIEETILVQYGAVELKLEKGAFLFHEKERAAHYFQVKTGKMKMFNLNAEGKLFTQGMFVPGESFGEPPLFTDSNYPACTVAEEDTCLYKLSKAKFLKLLKENPEIHLGITRMLATRLLYKSMQLKEISSFKPEHRILSLIDYLKKEEGIPDDQKYEVSLTRQHIADLTGLRVETVIRSVKTLEKEGSLNIKGHKIIR
ncbi:MAG: Crp/Fnr family transcriptional regulator [Bacteroidota bacterium]|nr:Crp/Fnr family transcriptional regulator [Odoribacter sp.]MDP3641946.1 Crp/Fnr family transcriptional regulator [Bacteroidota bacterium]